jgi:hypothetical protein
MRTQRHRRQRGQIIVVVALAMVIVLGMVAIALDGSFGLVQERRDQNGADFATLAGAQELRSWCLKGTALPSDNQVFTAINNVVQLNSRNVKSWTATYLDGSAPPRSTGYQVGSGPGGYPPPNSCGVSVQVRSQWPPFLAGVLGFNQETTIASASSSNSPQLGSLASIYSIDPTGPHAILGGGSGTFVVSGDVYVNTTSTQWSGEHKAFNPYTGAKPTLLYNDAIDAKGHSNIYIFGTVHAPNSVDGNGNQYFPLDGCFGSAAAAPGGAPVGVPPQAQAQQYNPAQPITTQSANQHPPCDTLSPTVEYDGVDNNWAPKGDPLNPPAGGGIADPLAAGNAALGQCPGLPYLTYNSPASVPGGGWDAATQKFTGYPLLLQPAVYNFPAVFTGSVSFADCTKTYDSPANVNANNVSAFPGVFRFPQGLQINLQSPSDSALGNNVMFAVGNPVAIGGNVPGTVSGGVFTASGTGNGGPCVPKLSQSDDNGGGLQNDADKSAAACGGTAGAMYPSINYAKNSVPAASPPTGPDGNGTNFSLLLGGVAGAHITLLPPYSTIYNQVLFFQNRTTPANFGFDALPNDGATDNFTGLVYNASRAASNPFGFWDPTGIPFNAGGTLQAGYGITSNSGSGWTPSTAASSVTVNGICVVDDFNTDGATDITILGSKYNFPNGGLGPTLVG